MVRTVIHFTDSDAFGGVEQVLLNTLTGLDRQRWRPVLFHHPEPGLRPLLAKAQSLNVQLRTVPRMQTMRDISRLPQFIRALWAERPAIFHAHLTWPLSCKYGLAAAVLARVPVVVATAHLYVDLSEKPLLYAQPRLVAAGVDRYLAVSHEVARQLRNSLHIPARKVQIVHNGIPLAPFNRPANTMLRATLTQATERPIVLMTARLHEQKGHRYLIEAAAQVPEAIFVLAGEGSERVSLEAQAKELGIDDRIIFLGFREDIPDLLANCDLFVLPSLYEGLPLSILEAMVASRPVIATAIGGTDEVVVHGETGLLVPPADPTALARAIRAVLADPALAQRLATAGNGRVHQEFSAEIMVQRVMQIYDELMCSRDVSHAPH
jgi:glycosyltransferase involved in cell wall biosynthesis